MDIKSISVVAAAIVLSLAAIGCDPAEENATAQRVLTQNGYTNVQLTGYSSMGGEGDYTRVGFEATSPNGTRVTGAVTGSSYKGYTIRFR